MKSLLKKHGWMVLILLALLFYSDLKVACTFCALVAWLAVWIIYFKWLFKTKEVNEFKGLTFFTLVMADFILLASSLPEGASLHGTPWEFVAIALCPALIVLAGLLLSFLFTLFFG